LTLTAPQVAAGTLTRTPVAPPTAGIADSRRTVGPRTYSRALKVVVAGADLSIALKDCRAGDMVCWTAY
jgi:hypothetical protein